MKDIKTFVKLFDLNVPDFEHFDYYISQYSRMDRWKDLNAMIDLYKDFENICDDPYKYKVDKSNQIIEFIRNTSTFNDLNDDNLIPDLPITKNFEYSEEKKYISIDINKANWIVLKNYDPDFRNELGDSYEDLLSKFDMHPVFNNSKQFRQFIFGNLNPKKQMKAQRCIIEKVIENYKKLNIKIECIKSDEVIYSFLDYSDISEIINTLDINMFKYRIFKVERCEDFRINHFYDLNGNFLHKELLGCNGNKFFLYLRKYIFDEPYDIRDLYFRMDGSLAIWNIEGLKLEI